MNACWLTVMALASVTGQQNRFDQLKMTLVQPGAGILVADSKLRIPMELIITRNDKPVPLEHARVRASLGDVTPTTLGSIGRAHFYYSPPGRRRKAPELFDISVRPRGGQDVLRAIPVTIAAPDNPGLSMVVDPTTLSAEKLRAVELSAALNGAKLETLQLHSTFGDLGPPEASSRRRNLQIQRKLTLAGLPTRAPSHIIALAVGTSNTGYATRAVDISVTAPLTIKTEISPGARLELVGADSQPRPVKADEDGIAEVTAVVRFGSMVRAFEIDGNRRREVPIVVPSGQVPAGLAIPIPGQNQADGGTGPTVLVAIPPSPFGQHVIWPEIEVDGATLRGIVDISERVRALILERPTAPTDVRITADFEPIGTINFGTGAAQSMELNPDYARPQERGAFVVSLTTAKGEVAEHPIPVGKLPDGRALQPTPIGDGRFRFALPADMDGKRGSQVRIQVTLSPPPHVAGDKLAPTVKWFTAELEGAEARPADGPKPEPKTPADSGPAVMVGLAGTAAGGVDFSGHGVGAAQARLEVRLPFWQNRFAVSVGAEYRYSAASGSILLQGERLDTTMQQSGAIFPLEVGVAALRTATVELLVRAGAEFRIESGILLVAGERRGGTRFAVAGRAALEFAYNFGIVDLTTVVGVSGIGASADGFSAGGTTFEGSLTAVRLGLGFRVWL